VGRRFRGVLAELMLPAQLFHDVAGWPGFCFAIWIWGANSFSSLLIALRAQVCFQGLFLVWEQGRLGSLSLLWGISIPFSFSLLLPVNRIREA